jgi:hypothetical protein
MPEPSSTAASLDAAARLYLSGQTAAVNDVLSQARQADPEYFATLSRETTGLQQDLDNAVAARTLVRGEASDHYTDDHVRVYWNSAKTEFETRSPTENANALVYRIYTDTIGAALETVQPYAVLDFECACGLPLAHRADTGNIYT